MNLKSNLIIPDADVIIELHELNIWEDFISSYEVYIAQTVYEEAYHYTINNDTTHKLYPINFDEAIDKRQINIISLNASQINIIEEKLRTYNHHIDDGEKETLAIALNEISNLTVCLKDKAAIKAAVFVGLKSRCVSVEKAISQIGFTKKLSGTSSNERFHEIVKAAEIEKIQH